MWVKLQSHLSWSALPPSTDLPSLSAHRACVVFPGMFMCWSSLPKASVPRELTQGAVFFISSYHHVCRRWFVFFPSQFTGFFLDKLFLMLHISSRLHVIWPSETPELRPRRGESIPLHDSNVACLDVIKHQYFTVLNDDEHTLNVANYDLGKFVL